MPDIHSKLIIIQRKMDLESLEKLIEGFKGADLRMYLLKKEISLWNSLKAKQLEFEGMFAIRVMRKYGIKEDIFKAVRKIKQGKKLESKLD